MRQAKLDEDFRKRMQRVVVSSRQYGKEKREREKYTTTTDDDTEKIKKCNCKDGEERCIQAVEVETPVTKPE
eukprot:1917267-Karenia_brevis.AAC.1